jgi:hypothetical protein
MPPLMTVSEALDFMLRATEAMLVGPQRMRARLVPGSIARVEGAWSGKPIVLETTLYEGHGGLRRLHLARGRGAMESLTVLGLPDPKTARPVFAADIVAFRDHFAVVFLDLCTVGITSTFKASEAALLARSQLMVASIPREVPPFCDGVLSDLALLVREAQPGADRMEGPSEAPQRLAACFCFFLAAFTDIVAAEAAPAAGEAAQRDFLRRMGENKKEAKALAKLFGDEWASDFLGRYFFAMPELDAERLAVAV